MQEEKATSFNTYPALTSLGITNFQSTRFLEILSDTGDTYLSMDFGEELTFVRQVVSQRKWCWVNHSRSIKIYRARDGRGCSKSTRKGPGVRDGETEHGKGAELRPAPNSSLGSSGFILRGRPGREP